MGKTKDTGSLANIIAYDSVGRVGLGGAVDAGHVLKVTGSTGITGAITANSFIKSGGLTTEFLKADGTVDTNAYLTSLAGTVLTTTDQTIAGLKTFTDNIGIGVAPNADVKLTLLNTDTTPANSQFNFKSTQFGTTMGSIGNHNDYLYVSNNQYHSGSAWVYTDPTKAAARMVISSGISGSVIAFDTTTTVGAIPTVSLEIHANKNVTAYAGLQVNGVLIGTTATFSGNLTNTFNIAQTTGSTTKFHAGQFSDISYFSNNWYYSGAQSYDDNTKGSSLVQLGIGTLQFSTSGANTPTVLRYTIDASGNNTWTGSGSFGGAITITAGTSPALTLIGNSNNNGAIRFGISAGYQMYGGADHGGIGISTLGTGTVYSNGSLFTNTNPSDRTLKNTINPLQYGLAEIMKLLPKSFYYNSDTEKAHLKYGFIAQDVRLIMPDIVRAISKDDDRLGLESDGIYVILVKGMQEQQIQIEELRTELNLLKSK